MKVKRPLLATAIALIMLLSMLWHQDVPYRLSPQSKVNPETIAAEIEPYSRTAVFDNQLLTLANDVPADLSPTTILGDQDIQDPALAATKKIFVDLTKQRLYAFEGDKLVYNFLVSTGKWDRTPTGKFNIWIKLRATKMEGGSKALGTYYYLPNVPYTMFFYNESTRKELGYGIHGTYWHDNFGHPMSHGCINMKTEEVEQLYQWTMPDNQGKYTIHATTNNPGTEIIIFGDAPDS